MTQIIQSGDMEIDLCVVHCLLKERGECGELVPTVEEAAQE